MLKNLHEKKLLVVVNVAFLFLLSMNPSTAQLRLSPAFRTVSPPQINVTKSSSILSEDLRKLYETRYKAENKKAQKADLSFDNGLGEYIQIIGDEVVIDIIIKESLDKAKVELQKIGFKIAASVGRLISGRIAIKDLPALESSNTINLQVPLINLHIVLFSIPLLQVVPDSMSLTSSP